MIDYLLKLERFIGRNKIEDALTDFEDKLNFIARKFTQASQEVADVKKILILLSSQYYDLKNQQKYGFIESESARVALTKLTFGFVQLIHDLSKYQNIYNYLLTEDEENLWLSAANFNSWDAIEEYLERYPEGKYVTEAKHMLKELELLKKEKYKLNNIIKAKEKGHEVSDLHWWQNLSPPWKAIFATKLKFENMPNESIFLEINKIQKLNIQGNREILSLDPLRRLKKLKFLNFIDTKITSLNPLSELTELEVIWFRYTAVSDLSPLRELKKLVELDFSNTEVSDLSPLSDLEKLEKINCSLTNVNSLYPIYDMENLKILYCDTHLLNTESVENYKIMNPLVEINKY